MFRGQTFGRKPLPPLHFALSRETPATRVCSTGGVFLVSGFLGVRSPLRAAHSAKESRPENLLKARNGTRIILLR